MTTSPSWGMLRFVLTTSQLDRLGEQLRRSPVPPTRLLASLQDVRGAHEDPLARAVTALRAIGLQPTSRIKTINTIIDKLRRDKTRLSRMQDIGGARLILDGSLDDQSELARAVATAFPGARIVDRRAEPNHGYRAIHVVAPVDGLLIEIQIRTALQDAWAQAMEKFADMYGRGLRYGESPTDPQIAALFRVLVELSDAIARFEMSADSQRTNPAPSGALDGVSEARAAIDHAIDEFMKILGGRE